MQKSLHLEDDDTFKKTFDNLLQHFRDILIWWREADFILCTLLNLFISVHKVINTLEYGGNTREEFMLTWVHLFLGNLMVSYSFAVIWQTK